MSAADKTKWDRIYGVRSAIGDPSSLLTSWREKLPSTGRALDLAGGSGRHGLWLAAQGLEVLIADVSEVALSMARAEAASRELAIETLCTDLSEQGPPPGPWDLIVCFHYIDRSLFARYPTLLAPGGLLLMVHPTRRNLERHDKPSARFLLEEGELSQRVQGLKVLHWEESWSEEGRHEARLLAQKVVDVTL